MSDKRKAAAEAARERASRKRWYITLSIREGYKAPRNRYPRYVWPKLFKSEAEAWNFGENWFGRRENWRMPDGRKIVSFALSTTYIPKEETPKPWS